MRELIAEINKVLAEGRACVYCSLVETRGSTPQKPGAAMLVFPDGSQCGTLGGGCVEAEVKQRALRVLAENTDAEPSLLTFNLDDNYGWDDGLICGGRMCILADPLPLETPATLQRRKQVTTYYRIFQKMIEAGTGCTEAVVMNPQQTGLKAGWRYLFDQQGKLVNHLAGSVEVRNGDGSRLSEGPEGRFTQSTPVPVSERLSEGPEGRCTPSTPVPVFNLQPVVRRPKPYVAQGIAYLPYWPRITVFIVGGGHVGQSVAKLAADVDFDIWVLDDREFYASAERFPTAQKRVIGDIGQTLETLVRDNAISASMFCLIVTRGHNHDEEALYHLVNSPAGYVGMIGSKRKIKLIYEDLIARGIAREALERVHAPLGFDIGSQTVPEIAVSIVAELIACRNLGATIPEARTQVTV